MEKLGLAWNVVHEPTGAGRRSAGGGHHHRDAVRH